MATVIKGEFYSPSEGQAPNLKEPLTRQEARQRHLQEQAALERRLRGLGCHKSAAEARSLLTRMGWVRI